MTSEKSAQERDGRRGQREPVRDLSQMCYRDTTRDARRSRAADPLSAAARRVVATRLAENQHHDDFENEDSDTGGMSISPRRCVGSAKIENERSAAFTQ